MVAYDTEDHTQRKVTQMNAYTRVMKSNPFAPIAMVLAGKFPCEVPRMRDCWITDDGAHIVVLTRTGGGNRKAYAKENAAMREGDRFVRDFDDLADGTFAHFVYRVPEEHVKDASMIAGYMAEIGVGEDINGPAAMIALVRRTEEEGKKLEAEREARMRGLTDEETAAYERLGEWAQARSEEHAKVHEHEHEDA